MRRFVLIITVLLTALALVSGCASGSGGSSWQAKASSADTGTAKPGPDGVQEITVTGGPQMRFHPSVIKAKPGKLTITLKTTGGTPHDLEVEPSKANTGLVDSGQQKSVTVTLTKPGTYKFICTLHVSMGMIGKIVIS